MFGAPRPENGGGYVNWTWPRLMAMTVQIWPEKEKVAK